MAGKNLKIVMTADTVGGVWTYAMDLTEALQSFDVEVHLAAMGPRPDESQRRQAGRLDNLTLYESAFRLEWMEDPWEDVGKARKWLKTLCRKIDPQLIHFNNYGQVAGTWDRPVVTVAHSCVLSWWKAVKSEQAPAEYQIYRNVVHRALSNSDLVVAPTHAYLNEISAIYHFSAHSRVIYNGRQAALRRGQQKEPFIFSAGRVWDEAKNMQKLTAIAPRLDWPVYIAGKNEHPVNGKMLDLEKVRFLGPLPHDELLEWMSRASIYALPALYEPFGLTALEAAQAGCALTLGNIETLRELWNGVAVFADAKNPENLAETINRLIRNENERLHYAQKAHERSIAYTGNKMGSAYFNMYKDLINSKHSRRDLLITDQQP